MKINESEEAVDIFLDICKGVRKNSPVRLPPKKLVY